MSCDGVSQIFSGFLKFFFDFKPIEIYAMAALGTDQQMLVPGCAAENGLALIAVVDAVNQTQLFQFFNGAVHCDKTYMRQPLLSLLMHFLRCERALAAGDHIQDHPPGACDAPTAAAEFILPGLADL